MQRINNDYEPSKFEIPRIEKKLGDVKRSEKNYEEAIIHYKNSIMALKILFDEETSLSEDEKKATDLIEEVGIPVHLNLAFCFLQLEDWKNVIFYCNKVLELQPDQVKALYRRCKAYLMIKELDKAMIDIEKLEEPLKNTEELKTLKESHEQLTREELNQGIYKQLGKKCLKAKSFPVNSPNIKEVQLKRPFLRRLFDLIFKILHTTKSIIFLSIDQSIKIPLLLAINMGTKAKHIFIDVPVNIASKSADFFIISPAKYLLNKFKVIN